uniref:Uncharacterized protein n=1 Tax=Siphoviridae sp. cttaA39 TaxID=2827960 RepID=A0A8S5TMS3_9CAUD|nr:MAG TPA: hypothetical protein [Siphoviridae sp. cttaA39]
MHNYSRDKVLEMALLLDLKFYIHRINITNI